MNSSEDPVSSLPPLRDIIRDHGLRAEKSLGQNFLLDLNLTSKIARTARTVKQNTVVEIGPGPGGLTRAILMAGAPKVMAIEYDTRAIEALSSLITASDERLSVVHQDALSAHIPSLAQDTMQSGPPYTIVANLPYNIATPLLTRWLEELYNEPELYSEFVLMFQKEVAQRLVATPSSKAYGRLSILTQWLCEAKLVFDVPASAFVPPPKVTSSIVRLTPRKERSQRIDFHVMEEITAAAFGQRRKMIRGSLKDYMDAVEFCGLRPEARAEELSVDAYCALAAYITQKRK